MKQIIAFIITLCSLLLLALSSAYAQKDKLPIKDSTTTIVGSGNSIPDDDPRPGPDEAPPCNQIDNELKTDFGVKTIPRGEILNCEEKRWLYRIYSVPFKYNGFRKNLKPDTPFTINTANLNSDMKCNAYVPSDQYMIMWDLKDCLSSISSVSDFDFERISMFVIHETAHIIKSRNKDKFYKYYPNRRLAASDPDCYDREFIKTYSLRTQDRVSESMAEAAGLFITNRKSNIINDRLVTISNFRNQCPATYNWIKTNLYEIND